jgi:hypothetical protein
MLGVDLSDPEVLRDPSVAAYAGPIYEIYGEGIFTVAFAAQAREAFAGNAGGDQNNDATSEELT